MTARRRHGFSLLEVLVTLTVIGFLVIVADYGMPATSPRQNVPPAADEPLLRELPSRREQAVATGRRQAWRVMDAGRLVEFVALPDGRVISSMAGVVDVYNGEPIR